MTQAQLAERVSVRLGIDPPLDGKYVSKLERGVHTWPNGDYRRAFREEFGAETDAELGFHCSRSAFDSDGVRSADVIDGTTAERDQSAMGDAATSDALRRLALPAVGVVPQTGGNAHVRQADVRGCASREAGSRASTTPWRRRPVPMAQADLANEAAPPLHSSYTSKVGVELLAAVAELHLDLGGMWPTTPVSRAGLDLTCSTPSAVPHRARPESLRWPGGGERRRSPARARSVVEGIPGRVDVWSGSRPVR